VAEGKLIDDKRLGVVVDKPALPFRSWVQKRILFQQSAILMVPELQKKTCFSTEDSFWYSANITVSSNVVLLIH